MELPFRMNLPARMELPVLPGRKPGKRMGDWKAMIIIGEKINGSIPAVAEAVAGRDADFIRKLAKLQADAGADFIDCCAAVPVEEEARVLRWMIDCIQDVTELPVSLDSPSPEVLLEVLPYCRKPGLINSVSGESGKMEKIFPAVAGTGWGIVCLLSDDTGIPKYAADRIKVFDRIMEKAESYQIPPARLYIDPLAEMLCLSENGMETAAEVIRAVRRRYPDIHITAAVSNVSFQLPVRRAVNQGFAVLAMNAGLDSAILDPSDRSLMGVIYAAEALLGRDEYCLEYISAYRRGIFGPGK